MERIPQGLRNAHKRSLHGNFLFVRLLHRHPPLKSRNLLSLDSFSENTDVPKVRIRPETQVVQGRQTGAYDNLTNFAAQARARAHDALTKDGRDYSSRMDAPSDAPSAGATERCFAETVPCAYKFYHIWMSSYC